MSNLQCPECLSTGLFKFTSNQVEVMNWLNNHLEPDEFIHPDLWDELILCECLHCGRCESTIAAFKCDWRGNVSREDWRSNASALYLQYMGRMMTGRSIGLVKVPYFVSGTIRQ